ncbi:MAG: hypothetical protein ACE5KX_06310 [Acidimicrobiia bacterium]
MARPRTPRIIVGIVMLLVGVMMGVIVGGTVSADPPDNAGLAGRVATLEALLADVTRDGDFLSFPGGAGFGGDVEANNVFADLHLVAGNLTDSEIPGIFFGDPGGAPGTFTPLHECLTPGPACTSP